LTNKALARTLRLAGELMELAGEDKYRAIAFMSAGRAVELAEENVSELAERGEADSVQGIGPALAREIKSFVETGRLEAIDRALAALPAGLPDLLNVKGLGVKKVRALWQELGVTTLDALEAAAASGAVAALPGFGKKTAENILAEVDRVRMSVGKLRYSDAVDLAQPFITALRQAAGIERAELAGALRRQLEVVDRLEVVVAGDAEALRAALAAQGVRPADAADVQAFWVGRHPDGPLVVAHHVQAGSFGRALWAATGDEAHVAAFVDRFGPPGETDDESVVYTAAGLDPIPPALREDAHWLDAAAAHDLPRLITVEDLRGTLHNHSTWSDGAHTLGEMADAARARGLEYFALCDHSRSLTIANGLSIERLLEQAAEVRRLNEAYEAEGSDFRVLHGTECDILHDGQLDFPDDVLAQLDFVVASIHSRFKMSEAEATERLLRAAANPFVDVMGHLTGRQLLRRSGYPVDHGAVIAACAAGGTSIEVNANPYRLDMDWRYLRQALDAGVWISINPDAHSISELDLVRWGVAVAQKGGLTPDRCLNAMGLAELRAWLSDRRQRAGVVAAA
jgi:DNA polymerase (family 10)